MSKKPKKFSYHKERVLVLQTNLDNMNPEGFEVLYARLFKAGALDVWVETILMKKMRPAFKLCVLLRPEKQEKISEIIFKETPTLGIRFVEMGRFSLPRKVVHRKTRLGRIRVKVASLDSRSSRSVPEYEDLKRIALKKGLPFREVQTKILKELA